MVVNGFWMLLRRIRPGFEYFQDEKVELVDEPGVDHLALKIGEALSHQRLRWSRLFEQISSSFRWKFCSWVQAAMDSGRRLKYTRSGVSAFRLEWGRIEL